MTFIFPTISKISNFGEITIKFTSKVYPPKDIGSVNASVLNITLMDYSVSNDKVTREVEWETTSVTEEKMEL